jgi:hypothetical protein
VSVISAAMPSLTAATAWAIQHSTCAEALEANYLLPGPPLRKGISALQHTYRRTLSPDGRVKLRIPSRTPQGDRVPCIRSGQRVCVRCSYSSMLSRDTTQDRGCQHCARHDAEPCELLCQRPQCGTSQRGRPRTARSATINPSRLVAAHRIR